MSATIMREVHFVHPITDGDGMSMRVVVIPDPYGEIVGQAGIEFDADLIGYPDHHIIAVAHSNISFILSYEQEDQ